MITLFFTPGPVHDYASAKTSDTALFARFFHELLERGIYFPPAQFEAAFVSLAHTESDIDATVRAAARDLPRAQGLTGGAGERRARWAASHSAASCRSARFRSLARLSPPPDRRSGSSRAGRTARSAGRPGSARAVRAAAGMQRYDRDLADAGHRLQRRRSSGPTRSRNGTARRRRIPHVAALLRGTTRAWKRRSRATRAGSPQAASSASGRQARSRCTSATTAALGWAARKAGRNAGGQEGEAWPRCRAANDARPAAVTRAGPRPAAATPGAVRPRAR